MDGDDDIVRDILRRVLPADMPAMERLRLEVEGRDAWGGSRVYVARAPAQKKSFAASIAIGTGATLRDVFDQAAVCRSWGYELVSRRLRFR